MAQKNQKHRSHPFLKNVLPPKMSFLQLQSMVTLRIFQPQQSAKWVEPPQIPVPQLQRPVSFLVILVEITVLELSDLLRQGKNPDFIFFHLNFNIERKAIIITIQLCKGAFLRIFWMYLNIKPGSFNYILSDRWRHRRVRLLLVLQKVNMAFGCFRIAYENQFPLVEIPCFSV